MSQINIRNLSNENDDGSPEIVGVSTFSATSYFVPPKGTTLERPSDCEPGSIRFNTDIGNLEYFRGKTLGWSQFELFNSNIGISTEGGTGVSGSSNSGTGVRGVSAGGSDPVKDDMEFITISTLGNATFFGNLVQNKFGGAGGGSRTRGVFMGGGTPTRLQEIDFITFASTGNAADFGDCAEGHRSQGAGISNQTRALYCGGSSPQGVKNHIDLVTIATTGSGMKAGDLLGAGETQAGSQSSTRGVIFGGSSNNITIQFITISTTNDAIDFGDLSTSRNNVGSNAISSNVRAIVGGGANSGAVQTQTIDFVTIATTGDATDFGDLTVARMALNDVDDSVRGVFTGGQTPTTIVTMDFITISSAGDAKDFGDLNSATRTHMSTSNGHGGL